ncbi:MAG: kinase-like domain-containing protein, partial [Linnemannia elongata]
LSTSDFDILRVLGVGSFGKVYQVRKKDTGRIYAMKVLVKKQVIEQKQVEHTIAERNVLVQALQSPFIVGLKFSFQTPTKLYLVQDFMNGGELFFHMQNEGTFSEPRARFYVAELVLALEHLHSCNVVYRDLKPENILLSSQGHIVLVDFGLCKQNVTEDERTHTFCGTTEYLAPEIVKGTGYGKAVDWWSLGVLLYEMLVGASPFADNRTEGTYHKILHQPGTGGSSTGISTNAQDLIQRFLDKNPKTRLGSGPSGAEAVAQIKAHPFFKGIDFDRLKTRDVTPPFQPHVGVMGDLDVSNFDAHFTDQ